MTFLTRALSCACYAMAGTIFYKKNFNKSGLLTVTVCLLFGFSLELADFFPVLGYVASLLAVGFFVGNDHWLKSAFKLDLFLALLLAVVDVQCDIRSFLPEMRGAVQNVPQNITSNAIVVDIRTNQTLPLSVIIDASSKGLVADAGFAGGCDDVTMMMYKQAMNVLGCSIRAIWSFHPAWPKLRIFLVAIPQFLRRPAWLKSKLQGIRSKLGPIYVMYVVSYMCLCTSTRSNFVIRGGYVTAVASVVAGVFLRPDNSAMLDLVGISWRHAQRRYYHGRLMASTFAIYFVIYLSSLLVN